MLSAGRLVPLADLQAEAGDLDLLRDRANAGDTGCRPAAGPACWPRPVTWTGCAARAKAGDGASAEQLAGLLAEDR